MLHASALAGACAGLVSSIVTCPLDVVKTKLQAQSGPSRPLRSGWNGPAGHPNGGIGGGVAREAWEKTLTDQARLKGVSRAQMAKEYEGLVGTMKRIWTEDGVRGFYRGLGPTIFGYLPTWAIYFTVYDQCKHLLAENLNASGEEDFINHILSAMTAGAVSTTCTSPLWVVKTRFMLQSVKDPNTRPYRHTGDAFVQIFRNEGWRGFYRGLLPSLFGVSHVAVQFPLYESFKGWVRRRTDSDELVPSTILMCSSGAKMIASMLTYPHEVLRTRLQMQPRIVGATAAGPSCAPSDGGIPTQSANQQQRRSFHALSKSAHAILESDRARRRSAFTIKQTSLIDAHEIVHRRTLTQNFLRRSVSEDRPESSHRVTAHVSSASATPAAATTSTSMSGNRYTGVVQACYTIAREEGIRGFYKGMGVNLIRTVPSSALTILTYEVMMQHLTNHDHEHESLDHHNGTVASDDS